MIPRKPKLYFEEQYSESFNIWSAIIRSNTEGKLCDCEHVPWYNRCNKLCT